MSLENITSGSLGEPDDKGVVRRTLSITCQLPLVKKAAVKPSLYNVLLIYCEESRERKLFRECLPTLISLQGTFYKPCDCSGRCMRVVALNEYSRGVLEALGWVLDQLDELDDGSDEVIKELKRRIRDLMEQVVRGASLSLTYYHDGF